MNFCNIAIFSTGYLSLKKIFFLNFSIQKVVFPRGMTAVLCTTVRSIHTLLGHNDVEKWVIPEHTRIEK